MIASRQTGVVVPQPSSHRSQRLLGGLGSSGGAWLRVPAETRANAAREGSGARPPGHRRPAEPPRPWEPGSARVPGDRRARGGPRPSGSCRPRRVPGLPAARGQGRAMRAASTGPGLLGQRVAASRLPGAAQPSLPAYDRASAGFLRETLPERPPPSSPSCPGFPRGRRRAGGSRGAGAGLRVWGVTAIPGRGQSRRPVDQEPSRSGHRCHLASLSRFPDLCPRPVPPTGQRPPASCAPQPTWAAPLPPEPPRSR